MKKGTVVRTWGNCTTIRQHCRHRGQLQVPGNTTGKWESWRGLYESRNHQIPADSKASPEESALWEEQDLRPDSDKIPHRYNKLAKCGDKCH